MRYVKAIWASALLSVGFSSHAQNVCDELNSQHEVAIRLKLVVELHKKGIDLSKVNLDKLLHYDSRQLEDILQRSDLSDEIDTGGNGGRW